MASPTNNNYGKVTLLKLAAGAGLLVILIGASVFLFNKKDDQPVEALDANPYSISGTPEADLNTVDVDSDADLSADCDDGSDCDDQDDRAVQPSSNNDVSAPAADSGAQPGTATDFAIEEEGIPAVDEKPAKTN